MKSKRYFILALALLGTTSMKTIGQEVEVINEVEIDLKTNKLTSTDGVNVKYGNLKVKAFEAEKDIEENKAYIQGEFFLEVDEPTGKMKIDSRDAKFNLDGTKGDLGESFGYLEVGTVTGAERPNDRIYFGGAKLRYFEPKLEIKNAWFTTDPKILTEKNPLNVGYHLKSDRVLIEPDKQITFYGTNLFIGEKDIIPFSLPWYRLNIRKDSEVSLFPSWGSDEDYGWFISSGILYEGNDGKFRGGFAPKYGDQMGLLIGRMENWYTFDNIGESRLNITDLLVDKKREVSERPESASNRWDIDYTHNYNGEYGNFNLGYKNATYNMISVLDDAIDKDLRNNPLWGKVDGAPDKGGNLGFYNLDTNLTGIGKNGDITLRSNVNLVSDKDVYSVIVADQLDDMDYYASKDYDLSSNVFLEKNNERYLINGYYNYLYDMDPGSSRDDLRSRGEDFGFRFEDKKYKITLSYDEINGDKYRKLNSWERDPNFSKLDNENVYGQEYNFTPWTVSQYDIYDSKKGIVEGGEYRLTSLINTKAGYSYEFSEKELSLQNDPFREEALINGITSTKNLRDVQYNRYENIVYNKFEENRGHIDFISDYTTLTLAGGTTEETIHDREGIYSTNDYRTYINNSDFYEVELSSKGLNLNVFGELDLYGSLRFDEYKDGYNQNLTEEVSIGDSSRRDRFGLKHIKEFFSGKLKNTLSYDYQNYSYQEEDFSKDYRLNNKENKNKITDEIRVDLDSFDLTYKLELEEIKRASIDEKLNQIQKHNLALEFDENHKLALNYDEDKRYTDKNNLDENHNDLNILNYGVDYTFKSNNFYYKKTQIESSIWEIENVDNSFEKITENRYGYIYSFDKDKLNFEFIEGTDKREELGQNVIDLKNRVYSLGYLNGGDIEHSYRVSYEEYNGDGAWNQSLDNYNSDVLYFSYSYRDKRFDNKDLITEASLQFDKTPDELTSEEINEMREILKDRVESNVNRRFNLDRIVDDRVFVGDYKRSFSASIMMQRNKSRYDITNNYFDSLEELEGRLFYSINRVGVGYIYNQNSGWSNYEAPSGWRDTEREHEFSLHAKIGKPTESLRTKMYVKFYDELSGVAGDNGRSSFDGFGIEVGKEFGYYEWAVAYERDYSYRTKDYEWSIAVQFKLLTFPDMNIFGLGATTDIDNKTSPDTYLFNGLKIEDID